MTTTEELQQLSRDAAGCLPEGMLDHYKPHGHTNRGLLHENYLHESTDAATEIMVRAGITFFNNTNMPFPFVMADWNGCTERIQVFLDEVGNDPMLAFRVAVLRALVALKGK